MQNQPPSGPAGRVEPSPRKKKGQISFAQNSFLNSFDLGSLEEANNKKVAEDVQFLYSQLQRAKKEREAVLERCDTLETQLQTVHKHFKEASTRRQMEEDAFRSQLSSAKAHFDRKLVKLTIKAKDREDLLIDWVHAITDLQLDEEHEAIAELMDRTVAQLPPSLRELMSRGKGDVRGGGGGGGGGTRTASRSKKGKGRRTPNTTTTKKSTNTTTSYSHSAASTDPDALLAIISENMNVLDNFNLNFNSLYTNTTTNTNNNTNTNNTYSTNNNATYHNTTNTTYPNTANTTYNEEVSDSDHARGTYEEYLTSENEEVEHRSVHKTVHMTKNSPSRHYSGLASHPKAVNNNADKAHRTHNTHNKKRAGSPSKNKKRGNRGTNSHHHASDRDRDDGDNDSVDSGTVTGSIMDFNDATSDEEKQQQGQLKDRGRGAYATGTATSTATASGTTGGGGLTRLDSDPHNLRSADTHYPTATTHAHTLHPTHPLQLQDSYGTAVRSATKLVGEEEAEGGGDGVGDDADSPAQEDRFMETMRNLQELAVHTSKPGSSSEKRRMSESAVNYTNMVRNILDSMSELSKSIAQDNDLSVSGIGAEIDHMEGIEGIEGLEGMEGIQGIIDSVNANTIANSGAGSGGNRGSSGGNSNVGGNGTTNNTNAANTTNYSNNNTNTTNTNTNNNTSNIMINGVRHTLSSGDQAEVGSGSGILGANKVGSAEGFATASTFDLLLAEAGVTLDAMSVLSNGLQDSSNTNFTYGSVGAYNSGSVGGVGGAGVGGVGGGGIGGGIGGGVGNGVGVGGNRSEYTDVFDAASVTSDVSNTVVSDTGVNGVYGTSTGGSVVYNDVDIARLIHTAQSGGEKKKKKSKRSDNSSDVDELSPSQLLLLANTTNNTTTSTTDSTTKKKKKKHTDEQRVAELVGSINSTSGGVGGGSVGSGEGSVARLSVASSTKMAAAGTRAVGTTSTTHNTTTNTTHSKHKTNPTNPTDTTNSSTKNSSKHNASEYSFNFESEYNQSNISNTSGVVSKGRHQSAAVGEEDSLLKLGGELDSPSEITEYSQQQHSINRKKR